MTMNESELGLPPDLSPDYQGIPETVDGPPPGVPGDNADDAFPLPLDEPQGVDGRTTASEELEGESLDDRLRREQPEDLQSVPTDAGKLMSPESGVDELDQTADEVAVQTAEPGTARSAEEQAVRIIPDADVMSPGSPSDGYLND
ncbi:hypothetical protein BH23ACT12_BH23ACT12_05960 [soil metagenome]